MSIASEITRLQNAKANLKTAINNKGGTLTTETLDQYASAVDGIATQKEEETKSVSPNFASGNVVVTPTSGKVMTQVTINKDSNLIPENIKAGVTIFGVTGTLEPEPSGFTVTITNVPDTDYASSEGYLSYSLDNGTTWVDITSSGVFPITLNSVSKIRFKLTKTGSYLCSLKDVTHDTFIATGTTSGIFDEITLIENTTYNVWIIYD